MTTSLQVAIGGLGAIGSVLARRLDQGVEGLTLAALSARRVDKARAFSASLRTPVPVVALAELPHHADIVVEAVPAAAFRETAEAAIRAGCIFMPANVGQLLVHDDLVALAKAHGARIVVPTGALLGLDAVRAAAEGTIRSVTMVTRKPPAGLLGAPYLDEKKISLDGLAVPLKIFDGTAREGAKGFPANVNVAAALSLAGIGPDRTRLEIWADPTTTRNTHRIEVEADEARFNMTIEGVPSAENPRTGRLTPLSVLAALKGLVSTLKVGS